MSKYFDEFVDDSPVHKCVRVRCQSCGFVRPKNATCQVEHLSQCKDFLSTTEGEELLTSDQQYQNAAIWSGASPSPDFLVNRCSTAPGGSSPRTPPPLAEAPSLARHLLAQAEDLLTNSTQHAFLSHAGCGLLTASALNQWLTQIGYISRSLVSFTGALIGKIRIPEIDDFERDSTFRSLDLLCSAVNNVKKELEFLEATKRKYGLEVSFDEPKPPTKGFVDLFNSASCPSATLLEGMVMLWAIETLFHSSFSYAARFVTKTVPISPPLPPGAPADPNGVQPKPKDGHITALREAFIENWKSENFGSFVGACRSIVDELAMVQPPGNGWDEMSACERVFKQAVWLWGQMFPEVMGMEEQDELDGEQDIRECTDNGAIVGNGPVDVPVEIDNDHHAIASGDFL
ncbi:hypothetical protein VN97_g8992 [Penicillium thymicola]|uniref:Heme oxygenase-like protein n=1 Tax=Penicillium thymicola TaxID=293382 RepID=A0AAI9TBU5_PENTH|nr:hypothetical protein VN97_g8992 [Penicillium thymicola]